MHPQLSSVFSRYPPFFDAAKQLDFYLSCLDVRRPILLSGIPRSGSTYAWNALRFICDFRFNLIKDHNFLAWSRKRARYALHGSTIVTIRNPYSIVTSLSRVLSIGTKDSCTLLKDQGINNLVTLCSSSSYVPTRLMLLRYEDFYNNSSFLFQMYSHILRTSLSQQAINKLSSSFDSLFSPDIISKSVSGKSFEESDPHTMLHGGHLSKDNGIDLDPSILDSKFKSDVAYHLHDYFRIFYPHLLP